MSDMSAYVRHDQTGRTGRIAELDSNYRAGVDWDDGNPEPVWVTRRHLIILGAPAAGADTRASGSSQGGRGRGNRCAPPPPPQD